MLLYATIGAGKAQCEDSGDCDKFGSMMVVLDSRHFDFRTIGEHYEHMGWVRPVPFRLGSHTFYYIGPGGGGVHYPDTFFYNLRGRILVIEFDGPYPLASTSKSPSDETKGFERAVLESFLLRSQPQPHRLKPLLMEPGDADQAKRTIDAIVGIYRHSFANSDVQGDKFQSTNMLEIKRISDISIRVDVHLEFYNGHQCNHQGIATYWRTGIFVEQVQLNQSKRCVFEVVPTPAGVDLEDPTGMCRLKDCGMRGGYNGAAFSSKERVKVDSTVQTPTDIR